ncbi:MAG: cytochrome c biogenesis protein CcsA [Acidobacteriota bacterium]|jgi:heme exporter protein C|nr:cytochrome c biogenesis protein CcsA [Acidobacteriota bacterium]
MRDKILYVLGALAILILARDLYVIAGLPQEAAQGAIFKIIFFHVPAAWTAIVAAITALTMSVQFLRTKDFKYDAAAVAVTEVGLAFLAANLVTGSIWARVIWGIWWTWDVRLTSALVCWLLYAGYLMLRHAIEEPTQRATFAAVFSILAFLDVPIVYFSIRWFRTQHPAPVFLSSNGSFPADWTRVLLSNWLGLLLLAIVMTAIRLRQEESQREIDSLRRAAHAM